MQLKTHHSTGARSQYRPASRRRTVVHSTQGNSGPYPYVSEDGVIKQKATLEAVFGKLQGVAPPKDLGSSPWELGYQVNERNIMWNGDLKTRMIKRAASDMLGISSEEMEWRLNQLASLLPGLVPTLMRAPAPFVARAAANQEQIAVRLLSLKTAFPGADLSVMIGNRLSLLLDDDMDSVQSAAAELRELLPGMNVDLFTADFPLVLDIDNFKMALEDCKRLMPDKDPVLLLRGNPNIVLGLVKGKNLIPYDEFQNPWA